MGHSLGSAILFDILAHQHFLVEDDETLRREVFEMPTLDFDVENFFAVGSPAPIFHCVMDRGRILGPDFCLPVKRFYNVFHSDDPVAYRFEPLLLAELAAFQPTTIKLREKASLQTQVLREAGRRLSSIVSGFWPFPGTQKSLDDGAAGAGQAAPGGSKTAGGEPREKAAEVSDDDAPRDELGVGGSSDTLGMLLGGRMMRELLGGSDRNMGDASGAASPERSGVAPPPPLKVGLSVDGSLQDCPSPESASPADEIEGSDAAKEAGTPPRDAQKGELVPFADERDSAASSPQATREDLLAQSKLAKGQPVDYVLESTGMSSYWSGVSAHSSYWSSRAFAQFLVEHCDAGPSSAGSSGGPPQGASAPPAAQQGP